jgi:hypothetical protein
MNASILEQQPANTNDEPLLVLRQIQWNQATHGNTTFTLPLR